MHLIKHIFNLRYLISLLGDILRQLEISICLTRICIRITTEIYGKPFYYLYQISYIGFKISNIVYHISNIVYKLSYILYKISYILNKTSDIIYKLSYIISHIRFLI